MQKYIYQPEKKKVILHGRKLVKGFFFPLTRRQWIKQEEEHGEDSTRSQGCNKRLACEENFKEREREIVELAQAEVTSSSYLEDASVLCYGPI